MIHTFIYDQFNSNTQPPRILMIERHHFCYGQSQLIVESRETVSIETEIEVLRRTQTELHCVGLCFLGEVGGNNAVWSVNRDVVVAVLRSGHTCPYDDWLCQNRRN